MKRFSVGQFAFAIEKLIMIALGFDVDLVTEFSAHSIGLRALVYAFSKALLDAFNMKAGVVSAFIASQFVLAVSLTVMGDPLGQAFTSGKVGERIGVVAITFALLCVVG